MILKVNEVKCQVTKQRTGQDLEGRTCSSLLKTKTNMKKEIN